MERQGTYQECAIQVVVQTLLCLKPQVLVSRGEVDHHQDRLVHKQQYSKIKQETGHLGVLLGFNRVYLYWVNQQRKEHQLLQVLLLSILFQFKHYLIQELHTPLFHLLVCVDWDYHVMSLLYLMWLS